MDIEAKATQLAEQLADSVQPADLVLHRVILVQSNTDRDASHGAEPGAWVNPETGDVLTDAVVVPLGTVRWTELYDGHHQDAELVDRVPDGEPIPHEYRGPEVRRDRCQAVYLALEGESMPLRYTARKTAVDGVRAMMTELRRVRERAAREERATPLIGFRLASERRSSKSGKPYFVPRFVPEYEPAAGLIEAAVAAAASVPSPRAIEAERGKALPEGEVPL